MREVNRNTRQQILDVATNLFYREGFRAVGIDTIVEKSGVAKMTLYRYFPSKEDLIVAYLEESNQKFWKWFEEAIRPYEGDSRQQIIGLYEAVEKLAGSPFCYGCTFQNTAAEFPEITNPGHRVALAHKAAVLERLRRMGEAAGARSPEALSHQLLMLMDGAWVAARMFGGSHPARYVAEAARALLKGQLK